MARVPSIQITFLCKENGRTVPSDSERCIEQLARVPSLSTVVFCRLPATQYAADEKAVLKKLASIPSMLVTVVHSASDTDYTASQTSGLKKWRLICSHRCLKIFAKKWRELRPCGWICFHPVRVDTSKQSEKQQNVCFSQQHLSTTKTQALRRRGRRHGRSLLN